MAGKRVVVLLSSGFEEIEAIAVIDVLRRADFDVVVASVGVTGATVTGSHRIEVTADIAMAALPAEPVDAVVLPGGMPGAENLAASRAVLDLVRQTWMEGGLVAAICAAPIVLEAAGLLRGRRVTSHPSVQARLTSAQYTGARVEMDERIVTSKGAGTALEFALALVTQLGFPDKAGQLRTSMQMI